MKKLTLLCLFLMCSNAFARPSTVIYNGKVIKANMSAIEQAGKKKKKPFIKCTTTHEDGTGTNANKELWYAVTFSVSDVPGGPCGTIQHWGHNGCTIACNDIDKP